MERINYNGALETIDVNGGSGDDQFFIDDTRASITLNGDEGNDFFQVGSSTSHGARRIWQAWRRKTSSRPSTRHRAG